MSENSTASQESATSEKSTASLNTNEDILETSSRSRLSNHGSGDDRSDSESTGTHIPGPRSFFSEHIYAEQFFEPLVPGVRCEDIGQYVPGGYCPIDIGVWLFSRYEIIHKLGWGGGSTVWMARDHHKNIHVAVKIYTARQTRMMGSREVKAHLEIRRRIFEPLLSSIIISLLDWGRIATANGWHMVIIQKLAGPSVRSLLRKGCKLKMKPDLARDVAVLAGHGLRALHHAGIVLGDMSSSNVVLGIEPEIHNWSIRLVREAFGDPEGIELHGYEEEAKYHAPRCVYEPIDFSKRQRWKILRPGLRFIDIADAVITGCDVPPMSFTWGFSDPQGGYGRDRPHETSSDVFSLACIWFELRTGERLIRSRDPPGMLRELLAEDGDRNDTVPAGPSPEQRQRIAPSRLDYDPPWKRRHLQRLGDVAASRALAGRLRFLPLQGLIRYFRKRYADFNRAYPCFRRAYLRLGHQYLRCRCRRCDELRERQDPKWKSGMRPAYGRENSKLEGRYGSSYTAPTGRTNAHCFGERGSNYTFRRRDDGPLMNLEQRLAAVGNRKPKDVGQAGVSARGRQNRRKHPGVGALAPPPVKISAEERHDFEEVLLMMLTWWREDRATMKEVLAMDWCDIDTKHYKSENGDIKEDREAGLVEAWMVPYED